MRGRWGLRGVTYSLRGRMSRKKKKTKWLAHCTDIRQQLALMFSRFYCTKRKIKELFVSKYNGKQQAGGVRETQKVAK